MIDFKFLNSINMKHKTVKSDFYCEDCNLTWSDLGDCSELDTEDTKHTEKFTVNKLIDNIKEVIKDTNIFTTEIKEYSIKVVDEKVLPMKQKKRKAKDLDTEELEVAAEDDVQHKEAESEGNSGSKHLSEDSSSSVASRSCHSTHQSSEEHDSSETSHSVNSKQKRKNKKKFKKMEDKEVSPMKRTNKKSKDLESEQFKEIVEDDVQHRETESELMEDSISVAPHSCHSSSEEHNSSATTHSVSTKPKKKKKKVTSPKLEVLSMEEKKKERKAKDLEVDDQQKESDGNKSETDDIFDEYNRLGKYKEMKMTTNILSIKRSLNDSVPAPTEYFRDSSLDVNAIDSALKERSKSFNSAVKKLSKVDIEVDWEIPTEHQPKNGLFHTKWKSTRGRLSEEDVSYINMRLEKFCEMKGLDINEIAEITKHSTHYKMSNSTRLLFLQYLAKDLTHRTPKTVFNYLTRLGNRQGKFTEAENELLISMHNNYTGMHLHAICARLLNRHRHNIYLRFQELKKHNLLGPRAIASTTKGELSGKVLNSVLSRANKKTLQISLSKISSRSCKAIARENGITPALAKAVFVCDLYPRLTVRQPIYYYKLCCKIIKQIQDCDIDTVPWRLLARSYEGLTEMFIYFFLRKLIETHVPKEKWKNFTDCCNFLYNNLLPTFKKKCKGSEDLVLSRLQVDKNN